MNLLAVNTSGFSASISLGLGINQPPKEGPETTGETHLQRWHGISLEKQEKTAQALIPRLQSLLQKLSIDLHDIDLFAVASGPGSFTGLRIGITSIKTLAYVCKKKVAAVNSLAAIAQNAIRTGSWQTGKLTVIINAFRQQFFAATFGFADFQKNIVEADAITVTIDHQNLLNYVDQEGSSVAGPGVNELDPEMKIRLGDRIVEEELNETAQGVGELAARTGYPVIDPMSLLPHYFRGSAAEEKLARK